MYSETHLVANLLREHNLKSVLDIGANIGDYSSSLKASNPELDILMLEANDSCEDDLRRIGIPYLIKCLGESEKEVKLFKDKNNPKSTGTSYKLELTDFFSTDNFLIVKTETLDSVILKNYGHQKTFDFLKLDTQGSEKEILQGGPVTTKNAQFIQLELSLIPWNENSPLKDEMVEYMSSLGFQEYLYLNTNYAWEKPSSENIIFKNIIKEIK